MTAPPEFGAAIEANGERPSWLVDGTPMQIGSKVSYAYWHNTVAKEKIWWPLVEAIRLEVPRYDSVYLALERGMVPWFGGNKAPGDWDSVTALFRDGTIAEDYAFGWDWQHHPSDPPHVRAVEIIGYTRKATSTALPLAQPDEKPRVIYVWWADNGNIRKWSHEPFAEGELMLAQPAAPQGEEDAEKVLRLFAGGLVRVQDATNPRGYVTRYQPLNAMRAALAALALAAIASGREGAA